MIKIATGISLEFIDYPLIVRRQVAISPFTIHAQNQTMSRKDIHDRQDIERLIRAFYEKVRRDDVIGYFFNEVVQIDWETHFPIMFDFWESVLFHTMGYRRNAMKIHIDLHLKEPLKEEHFQRWLALFDQTVDELFAGETANMAKTRARSIATMMQIKIAGM